MREEVVPTPHSALSDIYNCIKFIRVILLNYRMHEYAIPQTSEEDEWGSLTIGSYFMDGQDTLLAMTVW